jgi:DNA-binding FadR family transcriptional regulator
MDGPTSRQEHIDIADAIAARRADLSARLMRAHIERSHIRITSTVMARAADGDDRREPGP